MAITQSTEKFGTGDWISVRRLIRGRKDPDILMSDGYFDTTVQYGPNKMYHLIKPIELPPEDYFGA